MRFRLVGLAVFLRSRICRLLLIESLLRRGLMKILGTRLRRGEEVVDLEGAGEEGEGVVGVEEAVHLQMGIVL